MVTRLEKIDDGPASGTAAAAPPRDPPAVRLRRHGTGYSRFVRLAKYALPVFAGVFVVLLVAWPELKPEPGKFKLGVSDLNIETSGGQRVVNARFTGVDRNNRPFSVTAASAIQPPDDKQRVTLSKPKADVTLENRSWVAVTAPDGVYWRDSQVLELTGGVDLFHDAGYEFRTASARVDLAKGAASGSRPVHGQGPFGTIESEGFRVLESGDRVVFSGKAHLVLYPKRNAGAASK